MNGFVIETKQAVKTYGAIKALDHVDIHVRKGSIYGLVGDNGAGKTTLLRLLAGNSFATAGELSLFGEYDEKALRRCRRRIGALIEQPGFFGEMTVRNMMEYYRIQKGIPGKTKVEESLRLAGIWEQHKRKCKHLSLGMKQRLGLAIAMIGEPELLLLDEPINGLDPSGIMELRTLFRRLNSEKNITILLSSHILPELQQLATTYGFLSKGRLLEEISAQSLEERCIDFLEIEVSDPERYSALLNRHLPAAVFTVLPNKAIKITGSEINPEAYGRLAADNGLYLSGLRKGQSSLEDYYLNLKNNSKNGGSI
jgi:ABC-2 type transport system ATP-binding protein